MSQNSIPFDETKKIRCCGKDCGDESTYNPKSAGTVGAIAKESAYEPFFQHDGSLAWICPACWKKLLPAFEILKSVLGDAAIFEPVHFLVRRWAQPVEKGPRP